MNYFSDYRLNNPGRSDFGVCRRNVPTSDEGLRRRRCFLDRELNGVNAKPSPQSEFTFGQKMNDERIRSSIDKAGYVRNLPENVTPREFLHRIFPLCSSSVLELVWLGTGGCMEQTIGQLATMSKPRHMPETNPTHMMHPSFTDSVHRSQLFLPQLLHLNFVEKINRSGLVQNAFNSNMTLQALYERERKLNLFNQQLTRENDSAKGNSSLKHEDKHIGQREESDAENEDEQVILPSSGLVRPHVKSDTGTKVPLKFSVAALLGELA